MLISIYSVLCFYKIYTYFLKGVTAQTWRQYLINIIYESENTYITGEPF